MAELKPCPFCGGEAEIHIGEFPSKIAQRKKDVPRCARLVRSVKYPSSNVFYEYRQKAFIPRCKKTNCFGRVYKLFETEVEATEAWNRRAGEVEKDG